MRRVFASLISVIIVIPGCGTGSEPTTTVVAATTTTVVATSTIDSPSSTTTTIAPPGMVAGEQLPGEPLWSLVSGNDPDADRINLVFAPWGWDDQAEFEELAAAQLSWDGDAFWVGEAGGITEDPADAIGAQLGLFAIEPWRSSRDRFNVWITDVEPETPVAWVNEGDPPFDLPDQSVVVLALDAHRFNPELTSVAGLDVHFIGPDSPTRPAVGNPFADVVVVLDSGFLTAGLVDVPHELGHALFNLPDEYVGQELGFDGRPDLSSWPSCAEDKTEADDWWGDLVGDVDPMVDIWREEMAQVGFPLGDRAQFAEAVAVSNVDQGCYGVTGSVRATFDSLMNNSIPVLGSVNRRWAEQILELWEGSPPA